MLAGTLVAIVASPVAAQDAREFVRPETRPMPGLVPVGVVATRRALRVSAVLRAADYVRSVDGSAGHFDQMRRTPTLCDTPCVLYVPPGRVGLIVESPTGAMRVDTEHVVRGAGAAVLLQPRVEPWFTLGTTMTTIGVPAFVLGAVVAIIGVLSDSGTSDHAAAARYLVGGLVAGGVGFAIACPGIPLMMWARPRDEWVDARSPPAPRVRVRVGVVPTAGGAMGALGAPF